MDVWTALGDILALLGAALLLGVLCERFRQSAMMGYLLAGVLLGPNAFNIIDSPDMVSAMSELGVDLLLFGIGLEFSWRRLKSFGLRVVGAGGLQVFVTTQIAGLVALLFGLNAGPALIVGCVVALSSTAAVLRILVSRTELESPHGRQALGILLVQDMAMVPLVLVVGIVGGVGDGASPVEEILQVLGATLLLCGGLFLVFNMILPLLLARDAVWQNRELAVLIAIIVGVGSAWIAHAIGVPPALGAFAAGVMLAESPFASQIRADVGPLRTLLMTLFFSSIGMLFDPAWALDHIGLLLAVVAMILVGKTVITWQILRLLRLPHVVALGTGICLAQAGEFSFVIATAAYGPVLDEVTFKTLVSATIVTLFVTPLLVNSGPRLARMLSGDGGGDEDEHEVRRRHHVILVGFGPAGEAVAMSLHEDRERVVVIDLNPRLVARAREFSFEGHVGDARQAAQLEHLDVANAAAVVVTVPDPAAARDVIRHVRALAPEAYVVARSRYHIHRLELDFAGADEIIDEEQEVGERLAVALEERLRE